ncbi:MAG: hypothetical protein OEQ29_08435 [Alphaproteobacteria bacterium]|nr:hypothetical protein [Alphaproteobacteria bacterium]
MGHITVFDRAPLRGANNSSVGAGVRAGMVLVLFALILASCGTQQTKVCPRVAILNHASSITKFGPSGPMSPDNAAYSIEMTDIKMECKYGGGTLSELEANVEVLVTARRGPKWTGGTGGAVYFVIVTDRSGTVLAKRTFPIRFELGSKTSLDFREGSWMFVDLAQGKRTGGAAFEIWTGFQLTDDELRYNRARLGL